MKKSASEMQRLVVPFSDMILVATSDLQTVHLVYLLDYFCYFLLTSYIMMRLGIFFNFVFTPLVILICFCYRFTFAISTMRKYKSIAFLGLELVKF